METKNYILLLFQDLDLVEQKVSYHLIAQEILDILSQINFYEKSGAFSKQECIKLFNYSEFSWGSPAGNPNKDFAFRVRDNVNKIL